MDEKGKQSSSFQVDQDILDARGISMTVEEVAGLPTVRYSEKVHSLHLGESDLAFLKGLRRRIKNRLASQNSRRRSMEHLRRLTRELRVVRECKGDALSERSSLLEERLALHDRCRRLRLHIQQNLKDKSDIPDLPPLRYYVNPNVPQKKSQKPVKSKKVSNPSPCQPKADITKDKIKNGVFECRIETLLQQSVNHIYKESNNKPRLVCAKTIFLNNQDDQSSDEKSLSVDRCDNVKTFSIKHFESDIKSLSLKEFENNIKSLSKQIDNDIKCLSLNRHNNNVKALSIKQFDSDIKSLSIKQIDSDVRSLSIKCLDSETKYESDIKSISFAKRIDDDIKSLKHFNGDDRSLPIKNFDCGKNTLSLKQDSLHNFLYDKSSVEVLNLSTKQNGMDDGKRKSHGRKQMAPRRITYISNDTDDYVLDLKVKKESQ